MILVRKTEFAWMVLLASTVLNLAGQELPSPRSEQRTQQQSSTAVRTRRPNLVLMLTDNLGYGELGIYGGGILRGAPTPRIDRLANEGTDY